MIGGGDWDEDRIIPDAVRAVTSGKSLDVRSPQAVCPWQHVLEPLSGYMHLVAKMLDKAEGLEGAWNFGPLPAEAVTVREITEEFYRVWGKGEIVYDPALANVPEAELLRLSSEKAMTYLGWRPAWNLSETLSKTAEWYQKYYSGEDARILSLADIFAYMKQMEY